MRICLMQHESTIAQIIRVSNIQLKGLITRHRQTVNGRTCPTFRHQLLLSVDIDVINILTLPRNIKNMHVDNL